MQGFGKAVDFYRRSGIPSGDWLPYRYLQFAPAVAAGQTVPLRKNTYAEPVSVPPAVSSLLAPTSAVSPDSATETPKLSEALPSLAVSF